MSKKRVHEIAKELKEHGIDLDNKEVVTELAALGYDVKSHSSSLEDDQATPRSSGSSRSGSPARRPHRPPPRASSSASAPPAPRCRTPTGTSTSRRPRRPTSRRPCMASRRGPGPGARAGRGGRGPRAVPRAAGPDGRGGAGDRGRPRRRARRRRGRGRRRCRTPFIRGAGRLRAHPGQAPPPGAAPPSARPPLRTSSPGGFRPAQIISKPPAQGMRPGAVPPGARPGSAPAGLRPGGAPPRGAVSQTGRPGGGTRPGDAGPFWLDRPQAGPRRHDAARWPRRSRCPGARRIPARSAHAPPHRHAGRRHQPADRAGPARDAVVHRRTRTSPSRRAARPSARCASSRWSPITSAAAASSSTSPRRRKTRQRGKKRATERDGAQVTAGDGQPALGPGAASPSAARRRSRPRRVRRRRSPRWPKRRRSSGSRRGSPSPSSAQRMGIKTVRHHPQADGRRHHGHGQPDGRRRHRGHHRRPTTAGRSRRSASRSRTTSPR